MFGSSFIIDWYFRFLIYHGFVYDSFLAIKYSNECISQMYYHMGTERLRKHLKFVRTLPILVYHKKLKYLLCIYADSSGEEMNVIIL